MLSAAQVRERAVALRGADPETTLTWAVDTFPGKATLTVSFGGGGIVLAHLLSRIDRTVPVLFLDTAFHFPETYAFKERFAKRYGLNVVDLKPLSDPGPLYQTDPDRCCAIRKVEPFARANGSTLRIAQQRSGSVWYSGPGSLRGFKSTTLRP